MKLNETLTTARNVIRFRRMSLRSEESYLGWIARFGKWCAAHPDGDHARRWFQKNAGHPHYDICKSKRALAVRLGAVEVDRRGFAGVVNRTRHLRDQARA